jgi:catechol 2,3-dioxygenase-like lactoylglutathione lyase family enzyme
MAEGIWQVIDRILGREGSRLPHTQPGSLLVTRTKANDHIAIRVADIEVSTRFYMNVFGAEVLTNPFVIAGEFAEEMMEGPAGVRFKLRQLTFVAGVLELFQFLEPIHPSSPVHATQANLLHMGFQVDDVELVASKVESEGGRLLHSMTSWGNYKLVFVADPDGNVIELADASIRELVRSTIVNFPEAKVADVDYSK